MKGQHRKKKVISRNDAYHGATYVAAELTGIHATKNSFDRVGQDFIHHVSAANMYAKPNDMTEEAYCDFLVTEFENRIQQLGPDNCAAFIAEPIMGAGGVLVAPKGYHRRMWEVCQRHEMLYVADEVVTAFGRLGHWFASEDVFDYQPDILVSAKGITSGYIPLGVTLISDEIYDVMTYDGEEHVSLLTFPQIRDRLIVLNGWSKTWAMTGWRMGWSIWPDALFDSVRKLAVNAWSCVNAPSQYAGIAAIDGPQDAVAEMMSAFDQRRQLVVERANQ